MKEKKIFEWDFTGARAPIKGESKMVGNQKTFSVGVFQWVKKVRGEGLTRGPVVKRLKGLCSNPQNVFDAAQAECDWRNKEREELYINQLRRR